MSNSTNGTLASEKKSLLGAYNVIGTLGNVGMLGAPIMHFNLVVVPSKNAITGAVEITQAIAPPNGQIFINNVQGQIHSTGFKGVEQIVSLEGNFTIGESYVLIPFKAFMNLKANWEGTGTFIYGSQKIENVPVHIEK
jgi:hypothetical protein